MNKPTIHFETRPVTELDTYEMQAELLAAGELIMACRSGGDGFVLWKQDGLYQMQNLASHAVHAIDAGSSLERLVAHWKGFCGAAQ